MTVDEAGLPPLPSETSDPHSRPVLTFRMPHRSISERGTVSSLTGGNNHIDGYSYDAAGNLMSDGSHTYY